MKELLGDPHHLLIIIGVLMASLILVSMGIGLRNIIGPLLKKVLGKEGVTVNIQGGKMAENKKNPEHQGPTCSIDPDNCRGHQAEHERSLRNEAGIAEIRKEFKEFKHNFFKKLEDLERGQNKILLAMVASGSIKQENIPEI